MHKELAKKNLKTVIRQAGLTVEEFLELYICLFQLQENIDLKKRFKIRKTVNK
jgi:hypothetical protein